MKFNCNRQRERASERAATDDAEKIRVSITRRRFVRTEWFSVPIGITTSNGVTTWNYTTTMSLSVFSVSCVFWLAAHGNSITFDPSSFRCNENPLQRTGQFVPSIRRRMRPKNRPGVQTFSLFSGFSLSVVLSLLFPLFPLHAEPGRTECIIYKSRSNVACNTCVFPQFPTLSSNYNQRNQYYSPSFFSYFFLFLRLESGHIECIIRKLRSNVACNIL